MSQSRRPALGRGLSALIPGASAKEDDRSVTPQRTLPLSQIRPAEHQPRTVFDEARLAELATSISADGLLQPIVVRPNGSGHYEIIAGERRFRAASLAGLSEVPVVVRDVSDGEAFELALIENLQREDLGPLEEAEAFRSLADRGLTQEQIATRVGKDRATVANALRLLRAPAAVQAFVASGALSAGHARAILTAPEDRQVELAELAVVEALSVRATESRAREWRDAPGPVAASPTTSKTKAPASRSAGADAVESQLRAALGAPVRLVHRRGKGRIEIRFHSLDELERIIDMLSGLEGH